MEYIYGALVLHAAGKPVSEDNLKKVLTAAGVKVDETRVKALTAALEGVNIDEALKAAVAMPAAAPAAPPPERRRKRRRKRRRRKKRRSPRKRRLQGSARSSVEPNRSGLFPATSSVSESESSCLALLRSSLRPLPSLLRREAGRLLEEGVESLDRIRRDVVGGAGFHGCVHEQLLSVGPGDHPLNRAERDDDPVPLRPGAREDLRGDHPEPVPFQGLGGSPFQLVFAHRIRFRELRGS